MTYMTPKRDIKDTMGTKQCRVIQWRHTWQCLATAMAEGIIDVIK